MSGLHGRWVRTSLAVVMLWLPAQVVHAQAVLDPTTAEFDPSTDHNVTVDGTAIVTSYTLAVYQAGGTTPIQTLDLGKPNPGTDGKIRVNFITLLTTPLTPGVVYEARVRAEGPGGSGESTVSNTFSFPVVCAPTIAPASLSVAATGGTGSIAVTAATGCAWTATSNAAWISITSGASGTGPGSVGFSASANTSLSARTGTITVAGQTFTVTQSGAACTFTIAPASASFSSPATSGNVAVTASNASCTWSATSNSAWLSLTSGASGTGNGTAVYSVAANTGLNSRNGTLTVAGQTFTVTQAGAPCTFSLSSTGASVAAAGGTTSANVTASNTACTWAATSNAGWISVTAGATGTGNGSVGMNVAANTGTTSRTGTVSIAGQTFTVTQNASTCTASITPNNQQTTAAGGNGSLAVFTGASCAWTAVSNAPWVTITNGESGTGNGSVFFTIAANSGTSTRTGTLTVAGQTFTVFQGANSTCTFTISPTTATVAATGGTGTITVTTTTGCAWNAGSSVNWITATGSGTNSGTATYTVAPNTTASARTGTVLVGGRVMTVTQPAPTRAPAAPTGLRIIK